MTLRSGSIKRSHSMHHPSRYLNDSMPSNGLSENVASPSFNEWASQRFGFDHSSPNLAQHYLATPATTPTHSRRPSIEKSQARLKASFGSSEQGSPSSAFFEYELGHGHYSRARSPLGPRFLSPSGSDYSFSSIANCSPGSPPHVDRRADTRIELDHNNTQLRSPATGVSSSIAVTAAVCTTTITNSIPPIVFSRTHTPIAHRRMISLDTLKRTPEFTIRKTVPPPINVPALNLWSEKPIDLLSSASSGLSTGNRPRTFLNTFTRVSSSPSQCSDNVGNYPDPEHISSIRPLFRALVFIPLGFLRFMLAPFGSLIILPEFLYNFQLSKSAGLSPHSKPRGRRLANLVAVAYVFFSVTMFSQEMFGKMGLMSRRGEEQFKALKVRLVSRKVEDLDWVRDWASGAFRKADYGQASVDESSPASSPPNDVVKPVQVPWDPKLAVRRKPVEIPDPTLGSSTGQINLNADPLSSFSHPARFAKMHSKLDNQFTSDISPFFFKATEALKPSAITACLYTNPFWLESLPEFLAEWPGPVSVVTESLVDDREDLIAAIERLRLQNHSVRALVDFHLVSSPVTDARLQPTRQRMLTGPVATNAHLNLARFFSRTEIVWLVGDARVTPGAGLYQHLVDDQTVRSRVLKYGDGIVVPIFGIERTKTGGQVEADSTSPEAAASYLKNEALSLALPRSQWPRTKEELVSIASPKESPIGLLDQTWQPRKGPTNWPLWQTLAGDDLLQRPAEEGGGIGLGLEPEMVGGGDQLYRVSQYELNYSPNLIISREGQTWCTERFDFNKAACVYQMYLSGTELWVTPIGWAFTMERMRGAVQVEDDAQRMMVSDTRFVLGWPIKGTEVVNPTASPLPLSPSRLLTGINLCSAVHQVPPRSLHAIRSGVSLARYMGS
ncbi:hypothetical protein CROQUDRAFT_629586 [Cronartium quercuum f. sp. fusiforme G11]|uniref:Uncharacterized protein n=1 Tax=Cronartium quercuum f. sp. fusiforme G11 TaxID=708437 RepID=A0A9P6THL7_9BASI|nr:hypothetical protein CROQUDRAFT_629586 [Cronartium quercuum f. sp. fusiforme G11]